MNALETINELMTGGVTRAKIFDLQSIVESLPNQLEQEDHTTHHWAPGVYIREMNLLAGTVVVGKIHNHAHLSIITKGKVRVSSEFETATYDGPKIWLSPAGIKRAIFAIEDTQWFTVHHNENDTHDLDEIERFVIAPDFDTFDENKKLEVIP